jgi:tripartite-type tricarboxylate transporter receptor subunit TctC
MKAIRILTLLALGLPLAGLPLAAQPQGYPAKPVRLVVPYPPGGGLDLFARPLAHKASELLGQPVVVENKPGATGTIGAAHVAQSAADGYTLLLAAASQYLQPLVSKNVPFDNAKDFTPIISAVNYHNVMVVHPELPVKSVKELLEHARANPGKLAYVTAGPNTSQHLAALLLSHMTGVELLHVAYKGGSPALTDLLGGRVQMGILVQSTVMPHIKSGKLRALATVEASRPRALPELPTVAQAGVPGYAMAESWLGILGPAGLPAAVVTRVNQVVLKAIADPEVKSRVEALGYEVTGSTPEQFAQQIERTTGIYRRIVDTAEIKPQ